MLTEKDQKGGCELSMINGWWSEFPHLCIKDNSGRWHESKAICRGELNRFVFNQVFFHTVRSCCISYARHAPRVQSCVMGAQMGKAAKPQTRALTAHPATKADELISPFEQENREATRPWP